MRCQSISQIACIALAAVSIVASAARAQDIQLAVAGDSGSFVSRLDQLEAELAAMQRQLDQVHGYSGCGCGVEDSCNDCCKSRRGGAFAGYEAVIVQPHFENNVAIFTDDGSTITEIQHGWDYHHSPRCWLGFESAEGPGIQARYWEFHHASDLTSVTTAGGLTALALATSGNAGFTTSVASAGQTLVVGSSLELRTIDVEVFKRIYWPISTCTGMFGIRYAGMEQDLAAYRVDAGGPISSRLESTHDFEGFGPTVGIHYRRPLGGFNVSMVGDARVSYLFGHADQIILGDTLGAPPRLVASNADDTLAIGEARLGVEGFMETAGDGRVFITALLEAQSWWGAGNAGNPAGGNLGLLGVTLGAGIVR